MAEDRAGPLQVGTRYLGCVSEYAYTREHSDPVEFVVREISPTGEWTKVEFANGGQGIWRETANFYVRETLPSAAPPPPKVTEELRVAIKVAIGALRNYAMELRHPQRAVQAADELDAAWRAASSGEAGVES